MMYLPVSVIIPCFNCCKTIERAITSINRQSNLPKEVIIVNDNSNDNSLKLVNSLVKKYKRLDIKIISLDKNSGPGIARNYGWKYSKFRYIAFLDSDDYWMPSKLKIQYNLLVKNPNYSLVSSELISFAHDNEIETSVRNIELCKVNKFSMLFKNQIFTSSVMMKKTVTSRFPNNIRYSEDFNLWLKMLFFENCQISKINTPLVMNYKRKNFFDGVSSNLLEMQKGETYNLKMLYKGSKINIVTLIISLSFSYIKFLKRLFLKKTGL